MKANPKGVRPEDMEAALLRAGFTMRAGKGDHRVYARGGLRVTLDFGRSPALSVYVGQVLAAIAAAEAEDELAARQKADAAEEAE